MKKIVLATAAGILLAVGGIAHALSITPSTTPQWTGSETGLPKIMEEIAGMGIVLPAEVYRVTPGTSGAVEGDFSLKDSYTTSGLSSSGGTITYDGGDFADDAWLLVKDGNGPPAWYLFDLSGLWDGKETLELSGFWPGQGGISHISIYGDSTRPPDEVPEPATLLLLGTGLLGLGGLARKRK